MFANAESMLLAFKKKREPKFGTKNKEVYYNLLKVSTLLELKYPEPHLKILKSIKGDDNENHSNLLNIHWFSAIYVIYQNLIVFSQFARYLADVGKIFGDTQKKYYLCPQISPPSIKKYESYVHYQKVSKAL